MEKNKIDLISLKNVIDALLDNAINDMGESFIEIPADKNLYWNVLSADMFNLDKEPQDLGVGSLSDDYEFLINMVDDIKQGDLPITYMLVHVAPLIRFIAELQVIKT